MHLPDHYLDPLTSAATALLSGGAVTYAMVRLRSDVAAKAVPIAATSAVIFAAQMVNFPVAAGASGHLIGGALAGMLLGPWAGLIAMASVLAVQAIVFGDGGILALGANVLNMGVFGVMVGVGVNAAACATGFARARRFTGRASGTRSPVRLGKPDLHCALSAAFAGWLSVVLAALACALEMAASGAAATTEVVPAMVGIHALIGLPEGAISALVVALVGYRANHATVGLSVRAPHASDRACSNIPNWPGRLGLIVAATIAIALAPLASSMPDGLESVAERVMSFDVDASTYPALFPDYTFTGIASASAATSLAGLLGVALVCCLTGVVCFASRRHPN